MTAIDRSACAEGLKGEDQKDKKHLIRHRGTV
jgi:hypothetical protein